MYKEIICAKLELGKKFPRTVLYIRQNAIGIGLIMPKTAIAMLETKLYIRNLRAKTRISKIIIMINNKLMIEKGKNNNTIKEEYNTNNKKMWVENVHQILNSRQIQLVNNFNEVQIMTNKTIMQLVVEYIKQNKLKSEIFDQINYVRLYEKAILPVELIGSNRRIVTECFEEIENKSMLEWVFNFPDVPKPTLRSKRI